MLKHGSENVLKIFVFSSGENVFYKNGVNRKQVIKKTEFKSVFVTLFTLIYTSYIYRVPVDVLLIVHQFTYFREGGLAQLQ